MINNITLMGRLTADPELRTTISGIHVCRFSIAVDRSYTPAGQERKTDFLNVSAWRATAEFVERYFRKGQMIALTGSVQTGSYTDNDGIKRSTFEIVANNVSFCGSKAESAGNNHTSQSPYVNAPVDFEEIDEEDTYPF